ncbi:hypothetical protein AWV80_35380 [Cupriavidus sp. UYMU48A]|nr:hypothetical protein AWV80_35380 [Cupriavidus sp. UYMU48A]
MKVVRTLQAERDREDIWDYVALDNPERWVGAMHRTPPACSITVAGEGIDQNGESLRASEQTNPQRRIKLGGFIGPTIEVAAFHPVGNQGFCFDT